MSITDGLREWILHIDENPHLGHLTDGGKCGLRNIAVYIDAAHRSALEKLAAQVDESGALPMTDENMAEHGWVRLPVDADGVIIHVGDRLTDGEYRFTVCELATFGDGSWSIRNEDGNAWAACDVTHRMPTVEEVLDELFGKANLPDGTQTRAEIIAEFAARLRLAGEDE